ncbi:hypothetical protein Vadar_034295 [Vaccinium darrowii]|uniref:Uncharacterized protein n=1 Tax=Vaccinium darrowii TaxID=229202 RepID=A0ACB7XEU2_9ERIC|nr:hypothetical protein Vadar_034295 [Vaccinium darrowii]
MAINTTIPPLILSLLTLSLITTAAHHASSASAVDCSTVICNLFDCLSYVTDGSTATKSEGKCCSGLKTKLKSNPSFFVRLSKIVLRPALEEPWQSSLHYFWLWTGFTHFVPDLECIFIIYPHRSLIESLLTRRKSGIEARNNRRDLIHLPVLRLFSISSTSCNKLQDRTLWRLNHALPMTGNPSLLQQQQSRKLKTFQAALTATSAWTSLLTR